MPQKLSLDWIICGETHCASSQQVRGCTFNTIACTECNISLNKNIKQF